MVGFCGAVDFEGNAVRFSVLKRMCGLHGAGCAFVKKEFGILCDVYGDFEESTLQPVTLSYNGGLYTSAITTRQFTRAEVGNIAQGILEGYFEGGEEFIYRLDFSYALALYDGRRGELLLSKGHKGDRPLFYTQKEGILYFASSLKPLIRLYGGCVRVNLSILTSFIMGGYQIMPQELFADINCVRSGQSLFCSRLGKNIIPTPYAVYFEEKNQKSSAIMTELSKKTNIRRVLTDALFAFDHPQFDCYMASLIPYLTEVQKSGTREICVYDAFEGLREDYCDERSDRLGGVWNVQINTFPYDGELLSTRQIKHIDKMLTPVLEECIANARGMFSRLLSSISIDEIMQEKDISLRVRRKGMLIQCSMWFEAYNIVLV